MSLSTSESGAKQEDLESAFIRRDGNFTVVRDSKELDAMVVVGSLLIEVGVAVLTNRSKSGKLPSGLHLCGLRPVLVILKELIAEIPLVHLFLLRPVLKGLTTLIFRAAGLNLLQVSPVLLMLKELIAELHLWRL